MKKPYLFLLAGLLASGAAHAQQPWQPFRPGLSYQYHEAATPGDTTHVLRLAAGAPAPGSTTDSLFRFNGHLGRPLATGNCSRLPRLLPDNLFGATLRSQPRAVFMLAAANGRTLTLLPRAPLGQSWATGLPGLTASVTARAIAPVLGSAPDSVATITFSDGRSLRLSKSYGLLEGPSLDSYLNGRNARRSLSLSALPERGLGTALTGAKVIADFQPGDVLQRITESMTYYSYVCQKVWEQDSVISRTVSRTGDSLIYRVRTWQVRRTYGVAGAPSGFCTYPAAVTSSDLVRTLVVAGSALPSVLTGAFQLNSPNTLVGQLTSAVSRGTRLGGRPEYANEFRQGCNNSSPDSLALTYVVDAGSLARYSPGLGLTYARSSGIYESEVTNLVYFRKGSQNWGVPFRWAALLAARAVQPAATTTAFPTPFAESLTVAFVLDRPQPVGVTLHDALGRLVRELPAQALAAGPRQLLLPTAELPAGLYTLHLHFAGESRSEVLKVVK